MTLPDPGGPREPDDEPDGFPWEWAGLIGVVVMYAVYFGLSVAERLTTP